MMNSLIFWGVFIGLILLGVFLQKRKNKKLENTRRDLIDEVYNKWKTIFNENGYELPYILNKYKATRGELNNPYKAFRIAETEDYNNFFQTVFNQLNKKNEFIKKYGKKKYDKLSADVYYIGMTKDELIDFLGETKDIRIVEFKNKIRETLVYGSHNFVFDNDVLVSYRKNKI